MKRIKTMKVIITWRYHDENNNFEITTEERELDILKWIEIEDEKFPVVKIDDVYCVYDYESGLLITKGIRNTKAKENFIGLGYGKKLHLIKKAREDYISKRGVTNKW